VGPISGAGGPQGTRSAASKHGVLLRHLFREGKGLAPDGYRASGLPVLRRLLAHLHKYGTRGRFCSLPATREAVLEATSVSHALAAANVRVPAGREAYTADTVRSMLRLATSACPAAERARLLHAAGDAGMHSRSVAVDAGVNIPYASAPTLRPLPGDEHPVTLHWRGEWEHRRSFGNEAPGRRKEGGRPPPPDPAAVRGVAATTAALLKVAAEPRGTAGHTLLTNKLRHRADEGAVSAALREVVPTRRERYTQLAAARGGPVPDLPPAPGVPPAWRVRRVAEWTAELDRLGRAQLAEGYWVAFETTMRVIKGHNKAQRRAVAVAQFIAARVGTPPPPPLPPFGRRTPSSTRSPTT